MGVRVYLANDHDIVREGLKSFILKNPFLNIIGEYSGVGDLYTVIERIKPNLILFDVTSIESPILKVISKIKEMYPKIIIICVIYDIDKDLFEYLKKINVNGVFSLNLKIDEFVRGLSEILSRGSYVQLEIYSKLEKEKYSGKSDKYKINSLTKREMEVLVQVANGMFNKEIAIALNISERTVKNHLSNIFKKIEVSDRTQAAVFAIKNNVVSI